MKSAQLSVLSIRALVLLSAVWLTLPGLALAEKPDDAEALRGVEVGRVVWDINMGSPQKTEKIVR